MVEFPRTIWRISYLEWVVTLFAVVGLGLDVREFLRIQICEGDETSSLSAELNDTNIATAMNPVTLNCMEKGRKYASLRGLLITMGITLIIRFLLTILLTSALKLGIHKWCRYWHSSALILTVLSLLTFSIGFILYYFVFETDKGHVNFNTFNWITELVYRVFILHTFKKHLSQMKAKVNATGEERTVMSGEEGDEGL